MVLGRTVRKFRSVETSLTALLDDLGIVSAHFAGRGSADLKSFASIHPQRIASLTLVCPVVLDTATLAPLAGLLLVVTGDHGPGPRRVQARVPELPQASVVMLNDYPGHTWPDIAAERGDSIGAAMKQFLRRQNTLPVASLPERKAKLPASPFGCAGWDRHWCCCLSICRRANGSR